MSSPGSSPDDQQPQSPDLASAVRLDTAETLDGPAVGADPLDSGYVPPDRPYGLDEDGVTGNGMRDGDTLDERLRREQPENLPVDDSRAGRLVADGPDGEGTDVGVDGGAASAEEAAVHDVGDAEGPAETEPAVQVTDPEADAEVAAAASDQQAFTDATEDLGGSTGRHALRVPAERVDAARDAGGAAAPASGRDDVGPGSGL
jgi:hypothetical protein